MTPYQHTALERSLLNDYQRDFPLRPHPFQILAEQLSTDEGTVLELLHRLQDKGVISRLGPVFRPNTVGASTLAAASVPESRLETVAEYINQFPEVNHNYEREHRFNLWFVVNAATEARREAVLSGIASDAGLEVMSLPLVRDYYIDLGFDIDFSDAAARGGKASGKEQRGGTTHTAVPPVSIGDLIPLLQEGLPLTHAPYADIGSRIGLSGEAVREQIDSMLTAGIIKRFGVVVRHHELGYRANAMCVWDIGDGSVDELGRSMAEVPFVTLCYRRPRWMPNWPYNLFCMIHGKDRGTVLAQVEQLNDEFDLCRVAQDVLFSGRRFKQRGACFGSSKELGLKDGHVAYG